MERILKTGSWQRENEKHQRERGVDLNPGFKAKYDQRKVPLQGIGDGVLRQWCLVVDFVVACSVLCSSPSCYQTFNKSDTQSTFVAVVFVGE